MRALDIADCINETCPWSGKPVQADSLTEYDGHVVGFCIPVAATSSKAQSAISRKRRGRKLPGDELPIGDGLSMWPRTGAWTFGFAAGTPKTWITWIIIRRQS